MTHHRTQTLRLGAALAGLLAGPLVASLFFKERWLWMDEVLSYLLISDPSLAHLNQAVVSGMDANPPLFMNVGWLLAHGISAHPLFLRSVSVVLFAGTAAGLYVYTATLLGRPRTTFVLMATFIALTYLNLTLSTQVRGYAFFLLLCFGYFVGLHQLIARPARLRWLVITGLLGVAVVFTHNFGLFYTATGGLFFTGLLVWTGDRRYGWVMVLHVAVALTWGLGWFPNFLVQAKAGQPHSWIPRPTGWSFFHIVGELAPNVSSSLERRWPVLAVLRFLGLVGLWGYVALPRLRAAGPVCLRDRAFSFYLLSGVLYVVPIALALGVSLTHTSVFLSRYLWPGHLLVVYQLVYAWYVISPRLTAQWPFRTRWFSVQWPTSRWSGGALGAYATLLGAFLFYQNRKTPSPFPSAVLRYLPALNPRYPVFVETADYFLPLWSQVRAVNVRYLLDWPTAARPGNILDAPVEYHVLKAVRDHYNVAAIVPTERFTPATVPRFYVVDEASTYQIEHFLQSGRVRVLRQYPMDLAGHRLLECAFTSQSTANHYVATP